MLHIVVNVTYACTLGTLLASGQHWRDLETEYFTLNVPADFMWLYAAGAAFLALALGIGLFNTTVVARRIYSCLTEHYG